MPHNQVPERKRSLLEKRERTLLGLLSRESSHEARASAVEDVRYARIQLLKSRLYHLETAAAEYESDELGRHREKIGFDIERWNRLSLDEVRSLYTKKTPNKAALPTPLTGRVSSDDL